MAGCMLLVSSLLGKNYLSLAPSSASTVDKFNTGDGWMYAPCVFLAWEELFVLGTLFGLHSLFHPNHIVVKNVSEFAPALLRDSDGCAEVGLHLADAHVHPTVILTNVKVEILVLYPAVPSLRQLSLKATILTSKLLS